MHAPSPPFPVVVLPPLAPGYAWTLTPHGWCPMPYGGPMLAPMPATPRAPSTEAPALPPASSPPASPSTSATRPTDPSTTDTADPLADVPPAVRALAEQDGRVACALGNLVEARLAQDDARRGTLAAMERYGPIPRDPAQAAAVLEVRNQSIRLLDPNDAPSDLCYCGGIYLPPRRAEEINHRVSFRVSFVVPYYYLYSVHQVNTPGDFEYRISFSFSEDETPFVLAVEEEIRRSYPGYEPMGPDVGLTIVPEVATTYQQPGEATLYDCLFTDYR